MRARFAAILAGLSVLAPAANAAIPPSAFAGLAFQPRPGAELPEVELTDETGRSFRLSALRSGRPTILVLEYLRCPNLCGLVLAGLLDGLREVPLASGRDYDVLAIGIDPSEGPADAREARQDYAARYGEATLAGWRFLTGREEDVRRIADAVGFPYRFDAATRQFAHPAGIVLTTPAGRVARYLYGVAFAPLDLRLGLAEASDGVVAEPGSRLLLLCYGYDPASGSYSPRILALLQAAGLATMMVGGALLAVQFRRDARGG